MFSLRSFETESIEGLKIYLPSFNKQFSITEANNRASCDVKQKAILYADPFLQQDSFTQLQ